MLLCFVLDGQQMQTIYLINLKDIKYVEQQVFIVIMQNIKQSKPGNHIYPLSFKSYPKDINLSVAAHFKRYIQKYSTHSTRSVASSKAKSMEMSLKNILKCAGWKSEKTFTKH